MTTTSINITFIGGSLSPDSCTERLTDWYMRQCARYPSVVPHIFHGRDLDFAFYSPDRPERDERQRRYLATLAAADGLVLVSPTYHGTVTGLLKNALDYVNDLADDARPYLDGRAIGCVVVARGEQGAGTTLSTLRTISHALRGWPTPLGVALSGARASLSGTGQPVDDAIHQQLLLMLGQVAGHAAVTARRRARQRPSPVSA